LPFFAPAYNLKFKPIHKVGTSCCKVIVNAAGEFAQVESENLKLGEVQAGKDLQQGESLHVVEVELSKRKVFKNGQEVLCD
jgi:hypothetical protein